MSESSRLAGSIARALHPAVRSATQPRLPHQLPPLGEWRGWLLLAGRGAGKTFAGSKYMVEHVNGPPCMPGPHPHWMAIIAPTLTDAARSCFSGPSGIGSIDATAEKVTTNEGTIIRWPNGSQANLFGTDTEVATDRLRAAGNTCLVAGTLVQAERGLMPIEQIQAGERVWTRNGLRRVLRSGMTGTRQVVTVTLADGRELRLTPDHELWTGARWAAAGQLRPDDTVTTWSGLSATPVFAGTSAATGTSATRGTGSYTAESGSAHAARSRPAGTSIIASPPTNTPPTRGGSHAFRRNITTRSIRSRSTGIGSAVTPPGLLGGRVPWHALTAANLLRRELWPRRSGAAIVEPGVMPKAAGKYQAEHTRNGCALCAARDTAPRSAAPPELAPARVRHVSPPLPAQPVYDLMVEHDHEFFAGDVLVANCLAWAEELAAWRWLDLAWAHMRFGLRSGIRPRWVGTTTPRPRPRIKKLAAGQRGVIVTRATMYDNPHLAPDFREELEEEYGGTQLGDQELKGLILDEDRNALWRREDIARNRITLDDLPRLTRRIVAVDPSGGAGEQGITAEGRCDIPRIDAPGKTQSHGYLLADRSGTFAPAVWGKRTIDLAVEIDADLIVYESDYGRDMPKAVLQQAADEAGLSITIRPALARQLGSKRARAFPFAALARNGRFHHVGTFEEMELQMCTWTEDAGFSPDRVDSATWGGWGLSLVSTVSQQQAPFGGASAASRSVALHRG